MIERATGHAIRVSSLALIALVMGGIALAQSASPNASNVSSSSASPAAQPTATQSNSRAASPEPLFGGLGDVHHPTSAKNALAQKYFDQGLAFNYGFNHDEAYRSFATAAAIDPNFAMANWGVALVLGPNYNLPGEAERMKLAYAAIQRAKALKPNATREERDLIDALAKRYGSDGRQTPKREQAYADAMRKVAHRYPDDPDVQALFAESLMDLHPWQLWTSDGKPAFDTPEIVATLERTLAKYPNHLGANHYYIHAVEASPHPERAEASAERLAALAPSQGHLVHMPAHIFLRTGRYHDASSTNERAIAADRYYLNATHETGMYRVMYYTHNIQFLCYGEMMEGRRRDAIESALQLKQSLAPETLRAMPMGEAFWPYPYYAMARFGAWDEILAEPPPGKEWVYTTAMWHYARGLAFAARGKFDAARNERAQMDASGSALPANFLVGRDNARSLLALGSKVLEATISSDSGDHKAAVRQFTEAVKMQDALGYEEPPVWYYPVRESLGAELLADGNLAPAESVYREDLTKNPENPRSLYGLATALKHEGKNDEAAKMQDRFTRAWSHADGAWIGSSEVAGR